MTEYPNLYELLTTLFFICLRLNVCYFGSWWWCPLFYNREFKGLPTSQPFNSLVFFPGTVAYVSYLLCQCREFGHPEAERRGSVLTLKLGSIGVWLVQGATGSCACWNFPIGPLFLLLWSLPPPCRLSISPNECYTCPSAPLLLGWLKQILLMKVEFLFSSASNGLSPV